MTQSNEIIAARREIERLHRDYYDSRSQDKGFTHWVLKCLLANIDLADSILRDHTAVGGSKDLDIDAYWIDSVNNELILLQAKATNIRRKDVNEFRGAVTALVDEDYVKTHANSILREVYPEIQAILYDDSYSIHAIVASGKRVAAAARDYCRGEGSADWIIEDNHSTVVKAFNMEALEIADLDEKRRQLSGLDTPWVSLTIATDGDSQAFHYMSGDYKSAMGTVPAKSLADAYERYRSGIFRYNPRGPQGSNKVNTDIRNTLSDDFMKAHFHLLNNGITIVCDSLTVNGNTFEIDDFQVVNGCQTVYTLHDSLSKLTPDVRVNVRIIEGKGLVAKITQASNSQTSVRTEQFVSLGQEHDRIASELDSHVPPWYYEKQLGQIRFLTALQRQNHRVKYADRSASIRDIGQFGAGFLGHPGIAKYDLKAVFEKRAQGSNLYETLFMQPNSSDQLLLPILVGHRVASVVKMRLKHIRENYPQSDQFSDLDWLPFADLHLVGLIGSSLREAANPSQSSGIMLSPHDSERCMNTVDEWFPPMYEKAYNVIGAYVGAVYTTAGITNIRNFFRSPVHYQQMEVGMRR